MFPELQRLSVSRGSCLPNEEPSTQSTGAALWRRAGGGRARNGSKRVIPVFLFGALAALGVIVAVTNGSEPGRSPAAVQPADDDALLSPPQEYPVTGGTVSRVTSGPAVSRRNLQSGGAGSVASFIMWPRLSGFALVSRLLAGVDCAIAYAATNKPSVGGLVECYVPEKGLIAMAGAVVHGPTEATGGDRWGSVLTVNNYAGEEGLQARIVVNATLAQQLPPFSTERLCSGSNQGGFVAYTPQPGISVHASVPSLSVEADLVYHDSPTAQHDPVAGALPTTSSWSSVHVRMRDCDIHSYISEDRARSMMAANTIVNGSKCGEHPEHGVLLVSGPAQWQSLQGLQYLGLRTDDVGRTEYALDGDGVTKWVFQYRVNGMSPTTIPRLKRATVMFSFNTSANERGRFTPSFPMQLSMDFSSTIDFGNMGSGTAIDRTLKSGGQVFRSNTDGDLTRTKESDHIILRAQGLGECNASDPRLSTGLFARVGGACYLFVEYVSTLDGSRDQSATVFRDCESPPCSVVTVNLTHAASWDELARSFGDNRSLYAWDDAEVVLGSVDDGVSAGANGRDVLVAKNYGGSKLFYWNEQSREYAPPPVVCSDQASGTMYVVSHNRWSLLMPGEGIKFAPSYAPPLDPYNFSGTSGVHYNEQEEPVTRSVDACVPIEAAFAATTLRYEPLYVEVLPRRVASMAQDSDQQLLAYGSDAKCDVQG